MFSKKLRNWLEIPFKKNEIIIIEYITRIMLVDKRPVSLNYRDIVKFFEKQYDPNAVGYWFRRLEKNKIVKCKKVNIKIVDVNRSKNFWRTAKWKKLCFIDFSKIIEYYMSKYPFIEIPKSVLKELAELQDEIIEIMKRYKNESKDEQKDS